MKPISKTAYYCCGVRMQDAESAAPLIGDTYAKRLLGEEGMKYWQEFKQFKRPNTSNTVRHYIIDLQLREALQRQPESTIILIGAGLDSRAYRFPSGNWIEVDERHLIEYKNKILSTAECPNQLQRIPVDFSTEDLSAKLQPYSSRRDIIVIIEGVLMYLSRNEKQKLLNTLAGLFPKHIVFCDLMQKRFFEKLAKPIHEKLVEHGASFSDITDEPAKVFTENGYSQSSVNSIFNTTLKLGRMGMPRIVFKLFLGRMVMGYSIYTFTFSPDSKQKEKN